MALSGAGTNYDDMRRHNLSTVLSSLHRARRASRSELTVASGLGRSTVKVLVEELAGLGLVYESEPQASLRSGRPSPTVAPRPDVLSVAVKRDVRGVAVAFATLGGAITHKDFEPMSGGSSLDTARTVAEVIARAPLPAGARLVGIGAAVPGFVSGVGEDLVFASSLGWSGQPFARHLTEVTGLPAWTNFDAHLGLVAESTWGAARGRHNVAYLYGGLGGIGTAAMVNGTLLRGFTGMASALAHTTVQLGGRTCTCGSRGCFQAEVISSEWTAARDVVRENSAPGALVDRALLAQARDRIELSIEQTGAAIRNAVIAYDPEVILLDGFLADVLETGAERLAPYTRAASVPPLTQQVSLRVPTLGPDLLLVGASHLGFRGLLEDPAGLMASLP